MISKKGVALVAVVLLTAITLFTGIWAAGGKVISSDGQVILPIVETGNVAQVTKIVPVQAVSGFTYSDSINSQADTTDHVTLEWTAPMQSMLLTIGPISATPTLIDTSVLVLVQCSLQLAADTVGIDFNTSTMDSELLTALVDSLVDIINKKAVLTDSIVAHDSVTYIKIVSLATEGYNREKWTMAFVSGAGSPSDSCDTIVAANQVSIAMICDSMVAATNADAVASLYLTAEDSATYYLIRSDDPGILFFDTCINHADTHGTWTAPQANVNAWSSVNDTFFLENVVHANGRIEGIYGTFIIDSARTYTQGIGLLDSAYLWLYSVRQQGTNLVWNMLDADTGTTLPGTLFVAHALTTAGSDTLLGERLYLVTRVADSASDTTATIYNNVTMDYITTER